MLYDMLTSETLALTNAEDIGTPADINPAIPALKNRAEQTRTLTR